MRMHTSLDDLRARLPIPQPLLRQLLWSRGDRDSLTRCTSACGAQHEGAAEEAYEVVLLWCESPCSGMDERGVLINSVLEGEKWTYSSPFGPFSGMSSEV